MSDADLSEFLETVPLFAELPAHLRAQAGARCRPALVEAGEWLFRAGGDDRSLFVIQSGRVELVREDTNPSVVIGVLGPGDAVGELGLLTDTASAVSARVVRDSELLRLDRGDVVELLGYSQDFAAGMLRVLGNRVREAGSARFERGTSAAVLAVHVLDPRVPTDVVRDAVTAELGRAGSVTVLDGSEADPPDHARLLDRMEREHDHVVLFSSGVGTDAPWASFCLRHGDRSVVVGAPGAPPPMTDELRGCDVVFWGRPISAAEAGVWIDSLEARAHHMLDPNDAATGIARAVRRVTGRSTGVVLSGGGARALAHIGVLAELLERGEHIDRVGGSSVGALVAALFALGIEPAEIAATCQEELVRRRAFTDYTVPLVALLRGRRFAAALGRMFGTTAIEQLPMDWFGVSADLTTAELVVHRRGLVAPAVRATMALPGLLPPSLYDGRVLLDGSVLNVLPVHVMHDAHEGPIIASDVTGRRWNARGRMRRSLPFVADTISRSSALGGSQDLDSERALASLVIRPDTTDLKQLEFAKVDELVAAGRRAAAAAIAARLPSPL